MKTEEIDLFLSLSEDAQLSFILALQEILDKQAASILCASA